MKTLGKIMLKKVNSVSFLNNAEMRMILGGAVTTMGATCGINLWKDGYCVEALQGMTKTEALAQLKGFQHDADAHYFYDAAYWCCDSCDSSCGQKPPTTV